MTPVRVVRRWFIFNLVGLIGAGVQLSVLAILLMLGTEYRIATALAVEAAVVNNFVWHRRWTWRDGRNLTQSEVIGRFARFNLSVGLISIAQNVGLTVVLVERVQIPVLAANACVIGLCSLVNFLVSHHWVFREPGETTRPLTQVRRYQP